MCARVAGEAGHRSGRRRDGAADGGAAKDARSARPHRLGSPATSRGSSPNDHPRPARDPRGRSRSTRSGSWTMPARAVVPRRSSATVPSPFPVIRPATDRGHRAAVAGSWRQTRRQRSPQGRPRAVRRRRVPGGGRIARPAAVTGARGDALMRHGIGIRAEVAAGPPSRPWDGARLALLVGILMSRFTADRRPGRPAAPILVLAAFGAWAGDALAGRLGIARIGDFTWSRVAPVMGRDRHRALVAVLGIATTAGRGGAAVRDPPRHGCRSRGQGGPARRASRQTQGRRGRGLLTCGRPAPPSSAASIGALVGAAIAGSTIWERWHRRRQW